MEGRNGCRGGPSARSLLLVALGVALVSRVVVLFLFGDVSASAKTWEYGEQAACALRNNGDLCLYYSPARGASYPSAYMPPLLSYGWLGLLDLFGEGPLARACWLAGNLLAALGCVVLTFHLAMKLWPSRWSAFAAAILFAVYPTFVWVTATYHQTNWAVLLLLFVSAVAVKLTEGTRPWRYGAIAGLLCGLAALNRSEMLLVGPVLIAVGAAWRRRLPVLAKAGLAGALVMLLTLTPWTVRNYEQFGKFIPAAQSSGYNLWKGFNPYTNGSGNLSEDPTRPGWRERESIRLAVTPGARYETRVQDAYMKVFESDLNGASPVRIAELTVNKVLLLWGFDWTDHEITGRMSYRLPWLATSLLALAGLAAAWRGRHKLRIAPAAIYAAAIGLLTTAYVLTAVHARYRMHIEPYLFILAGIGAQAVWAWLRSGKVPAERTFRADVPDEADSLHTSEDAERRRDTIGLWSVSPRRRTSFGQGISG